MSLGRDHLAGDYWLPKEPATATVSLQIPVDYTGCESEQERAQVRVNAKRKARQQMAANAELLKALITCKEELFQFHEDWHPACINHRPDRCSSREALNEAALAIEKATQ